MAEVETGEGPIYDHEALLEASTKIIDSFRSRFPNPNHIPFDERNTIVTRIKEDADIDQKAAQQMDLSNEVLREVQIYNNTLANTVRAIKELEKTNERLFRPDDFYAEMFKTDEHMEKIRTRLEKRKGEVVHAEQRKKNKLQKKMQKQLKHKKHLDAAKEKRQNLNAIDNWKQSIKNKEGKTLDHFVGQGESRGKNKEKYNNKGGKGGKKARTFSKVGVPGSDNSKFHNQKMKKLKKKKRPGKEARNKSSGSKRRN